MHEYEAKPGVPYGVAACVVVPPPPLVQDIAHLHSDVRQLAEAIVALAGDLLGHGGAAPSSGSVAAGPEAPAVELTRQRIAEMRGTVSGARNHVQEMRRALLGE